MKAIWGVLVAVVAGLGLLFFYNSVLREPSLPEGALFLALVEAAEQEQEDLGPVFARFVPPDAPLTERIEPLAANGFSCALRPAYVEGSTILTCLRPLAGRGFCKGFNYFSYQTATGEIIETVGTSFEARGRANMFGQCENNRSAFLHPTGEDG